MNFTLCNYLLDSARSVQYKPVQFSNVLPAGPCADAIALMASVKFVSGPLSGQTFELPLGEQWLIGRTSKAEIPCHDRSLSRRHCLIESGMLGYLKREGRAGP